MIRREIRRVREEEVRSVQRITRVLLKFSELSLNEATGYSVDDNHTKRIARNYEDVNNINYTRIRHVNECSQLKPHGRSQREG